MKELSITDIFVNHWCNFKKIIIAMTSYDKTIKLVHDHKFRFPLQVEFW